MGQEKKPVAGPFAVESRGMKGLSETLIDYAVAAISAYMGAYAFGTGAAGIALAGKAAKNVLSQYEDSLYSLIKKCMEEAGIPEEGRQWCKEEAFSFFERTLPSPELLIGNENPVSDYVESLRGTLSDMEKNWLAAVCQYVWDALSEGIRKTPEYQLALEKIVKKHDRHLKNLEKRLLQSDTDHSAEEERIRRQCAGLFQKIKQEHPSRKLMMKIDNEPVMIPLQGCDEEGKHFRAADIVSQGEHLILLGNGGTGKSLALLSVHIGEMLPVYIPLHSVLPDDKKYPIRNYIRMRILYEDPAQYEIFMRMAAAGEPRILLVLDGLNEVPYTSISGVDQGDIIDEINSLYHMTGIKIVLSSRTNILAEHFGLMGTWKTLALEKLDKEQIRAYLMRAGVPCPKRPEMEELLRVPLMLSLYGIIGEIGTRYPDAKYDWRIGANSACLIWNFLQQELLRFEIGNKREDSFLCAIAAEIIAPYIAWQMEKNNVFAIHVTVFFPILCDAVKFAEKLEKTKALPAHIYVIMMEQEDIKLSEKRIYTLLTRDIHLFSLNQDKTMELLHQNFRDCLAAVHMCNLACLAQHTKVYPDEWKDSVNPYVIDYIAELAEADAQTQNGLHELWEMNRKTHPTNAGMTYTLLELQKRLLKYDFSTLDWSGMDLSNLSLYQVHVPGNACLKLPKDSRLLKGTKVSDKTFAKIGHDAFVMCCAVSADEKILVSGDFAGRICVWNLDYGILLHIIETGFAVSCIALTADGHKTVCGTLKGMGYVYDTWNGAQLFEITGHEAEIFDCIPVSDTVICASSRDHLISIWDLHSGALLHRLDGGSGQLNDVEWSSSTGMIFGGCEDGTVCIWDARTGCCTGRLLCRPEVTCIYCFEDGHSIAVGTGGGVVEIWDVKQSLCIAVLDMETGGRVDSICVPDRNKLVCRTADCIQIWDLDEQICIYKQEHPHSGMVNDFILPLHKSAFFTNSGCGLYLWDLNERSILKSYLGHRSDISSSIVFSNGRRLLSTSFDREIRIWNIADGECLHIFSSSEPKGGCCKSNIEFLPERSLLAWNEWNDYENSSIDVFHLETGDRISTISVKERDLCISHCNCCLLVGEGRKIKEWDIASQRWCDEITYCGEEAYGFPLIGSIAASADGNVMLAAASQQGQIEVYIKTKGEQNLIALSNRIVSTAASPDGSSVCAMEEHCGLHVWSIEDMDVKHTVPVDVSYDDKALYTMDSKRILFSNINRICVYAVEERQILHRIQEEEMYICDLSVSMDGKMFAAGAFAGDTIRIYDLSNYRCLAEFRDPFDSAEYIKTSFSKDGKYLYIASFQDNHIFRWDIMNSAGRMLSLLPEIDVGGVDFSECVWLD